MEFSGENASSKNKWEIKSSEEYEHLRDDLMKGTHKVGWESAASEVEKLLGS